MENLKSNCCDTSIDMFDRCNKCGEENGYYTIPTCKGRECNSTDVSPRYDAHGIPTGNYCEPCYKNNYPYRKDRYPTIETHGYGERLDDDY